MTPRTFYLSEDILWLDFKQMKTVGFANPIPVDGDRLECHMSPSGKTAVYEFEFVKPGTAPGTFSADMRELGYKDTATKIHPIMEGKKVVGSVTGAIFTKQVHSSRHFMKTPAGIALGVASLAQAKGHGATTVEIIDLDLDKKYYATIKLIEEKGLKLNRGYGDQLNLLMEFWSSHNDEQKALGI